MAITIAMRTQVSQLYVSLFGRAPDAEGMGFWASAMADGMSMARVAQEMYNTAPARDYYPTAATNREIISIFYLNVLGREADAGGLDFWTREMDLAATKGDVFAKLLNNVVNYNGSDADGLKSQSLFLNKVAVAQYYGENGGDIVGAADVLVGVTDKYATVIEAKAAIDAGGVIGVQTYEILNQASVFEGGAVTFNITTTGVAPGTDLVYSVTGTGNALPSTKLGVATVNADGTASVTVNTFDNNLIGDDGVLSFKLMKGAVVLKAAEFVNVVNNDQVQTYLVTNTTTVEEGNSVTYTITTTGVAAGTEVAYVVTGTGNASASAQTGAVVINAEGKATVTINTMENQNASDSGTLSFELKSGAQLLAAAAAVDVVNDDNPAAYTVTVNDRTIDEGDVLTYSISTTGVAPGTDIAYVVTGTGNATASTQVGLATVNAQGNATVTINTYANDIVADEGVLSFKLVSNSNTLASAPTVTIANDDLPPPSSSVAVTAKEIFGTGDINEGDIVQFTVSTSGYAAGTMLPYTITGTNNVSDILKAGFVTIGVDGKAIVQVQTNNNTNWGDSGVLTFELGDLATKTVTVLNDEDAEIINNTYNATSEKAMTTGSDRITDTNGGDDTFYVTIGSYDPTLTSGDKLDGGVGEDTLYVKVNGNDAEFDEMNDNTPAFKNIEHVIVDLTDHDLDAYSGDPGIYSNGSDQAIDASYFDTDNSLETLTVIAVKDYSTEEYEDVFAHKDMTIEYIGSGVSDDAVELNEDIYLGVDVKNIAIALDGVGGDSNGAWLGFSQEIENSDDESALESLTVSGNLAKNSYFNFLGLGEDTLGLLDNDASLVLTSFSSDIDVSDSDYDQASPETITISLDKTDDVESVMVLIEPVSGVILPLAIASGAPVGYLSELTEFGLLSHATTVDFSASTVDITTILMGWQFTADTVEIKFGEGNDTLWMDPFTSFSDTDYDTDVATAITIDLGEYNDQNTILLSNELSTELFDGISDDDIGGNIKLDGGNSVRDIDLTEDLITIVNFDVDEDKLALAFTVLHSDDDTYVGENFTLQNTGSIQAAADAGARNANRVDEKFFGAVEAVANYLIDQAAAIDNSDDELSEAEVNEYYAAAFKYGDDTYIYIDTNRNDWMNYGEDSYTYHALSNGDTLIKLTGVSPADVNIDFTFKASLVGL